MSERAGNKLPRLVNTPCRTALNGPSNEAIAIDAGKRLLKQLLGAIHYSQRRHGLFSADVSKEID
jgi:hypothetical protein